jgi:hypothetical protein
VRCTGAARWKGSLSPVLWGRPCAVPLAGLPDRGSPRPPAGTTAGAHRTRVLALAAAVAAALGLAALVVTGHGPWPGHAMPTWGGRGLASWWPAWPGCSCPRSSCWRRSSASPVGRGPCVCPAGSLPGGLGRAAPGCGRWPLEGLLVDRVDEGMGDLGGSAGQWRPRTTAPATARSWSGVADEQGRCPGSALSPVAAYPRCTKTSGHAPGGRRIPLSLFMDKQDEDAR